MPSSSRTKQKLNPSKHLRLQPSPHHSSASSLVYSAPVVNSPEPGRLWLPADVLPSAAINSFPVILILKRSCVLCLKCTNLEPEHNEKVDWLGRVPSGLG